jgi:signal transduction histidine kinase/DNA-binding response OmpR family regulator
MSAENSKTKILIVDDLPEKFLVYQSILEELGQEIISARSGMEALKQVLKHDFAVILLDVNMPGMDGFETAQLIRKRKRSAHTPIIFLTAFADEVRSAQGYATGGVDYISTPVVPEILRAKVRVFVELSRMRQQVAFQAEEQAKRAAAEESARRSSFLSEASRALANSLDFEATLRTLTRLALPQFADFSFVTLVDEHGSVERTESAWIIPPGKTVTTSSRPIHLQDWLYDVTTRVMASGKLEHFVLEAPRSPAIWSPVDHGNSFPGFHVHSVVVFPLVARGKTRGSIALALGPSGKQWSSSEISLIDEFSGRAGVALDNALLVRDIQENDRRKNEFLAMLSHELRNPLAPVRNALQVLQLCGDDHEKIDWARAVIDRQVTHLVRLVDDLLDVSRITRGKIRFQPESLEVAGMVENAVESCKPDIDAHGHELTVSMPNEPIRIMADPARLAQVLSNLLHNACKYTPDGGHIWLTVERDENEVVFRVQDTGAGIPRDMLSKIFDLFTQLDGSLDRSQGGLGIGLTLVRSLVEMHQGTVQAFSDGPDQGSEFVIRLPLLASERRQTPKPEPASLNGQAVKCHYRVLVVDDNCDAAESLAILLRLGGHEVQIAHDGYAALQLARDFVPEVALLDIGLPGLDGYELAKKLRDRPETSTCLMVAVSGYGQDEDRNRSRQASFEHHLTKPVDYASLEKVIQSISEHLKPAAANCETA